MLRTLKHTKVQKKLLVSITFIFDHKFSGAHIETYQGTKKTINFSKKLKHLFLIINDFLNTCNHFR